MEGVGDKRIRTCGVGMNKSLGMRLLSAEEIGSGTSKQKEAFRCRVAPRLSHGSGRYALERKRELMGRSTSTDGVHGPTKRSSLLTRFVDGPDRSHVTTALRTSFGVYVVDPRKHNRSTIQAEPAFCGFTTPFIHSLDKNWRSSEKERTPLGPVTVSTNAAVRKTKTVAACASPAGCLMRRFAGE